MVYLLLVRNHQHLYLLIAADAYLSDEKNGKLAFKTAPYNKIIPGADINILIAQETFSFLVGSHDPSSLKNDGNDDHPTSSCSNS